MRRFLLPAGPFIILLFSFFALSAQDTVIVNTDSLMRSRIFERADSLLNGPWFINSTGYQKRDSTRIESINIDSKREVITVRADKQLAYAPARESTIDSIENGLLAVLDELYKEYRIQVYSNGKNIRDYIPNYYRSDPKTVDRQRTPGKFRRKSPPLVQNQSRNFLKESSLYNKNIAMWHSHGWYYEPSLHRWEWQRARIFQTVEDIYPMAYTLPMLLPMLENAGATVFLPRERDLQVHEVVVDNDGSHQGSFYVASPGAEADTTESGFAIGTPPYTDENPFQLGTFESLTSSRKETESVRWIPEIPESGEYAVYISYNASDENVDDALYEVFHAGGVTEFRVNQQMGGSTWVYLGKFRFRKGLHPYKGMVVLSNQSSRRSDRITADAVRFGGGMGIISRNGLTGKRPRYQEAARYYLQYAGFPDTLVWKLNTPEHDYKDDYQSRGEWVNYLMGSPSGPLVNRQAEGLGIPIDLSFAFHTDAGITDNDTVIGTLGIFSTTPGGGYFPGGMSRMASRDLTDIIQTQIVEDIREKYDPAWIRRAMWDRGYSEAFRPNVPAMLLELFSHQNLLDMRFGQEPLYRFDVSRAIYKGILKFMESMYGIDYVVQPLPVTHFSTNISNEGEIQLLWEAQPDPLEPTALPDYYRIYTRINDGGYDEGIPVDSSTFTLSDYHRDSIYSFKITAVNGGGESFPSEELSVYSPDQSRGSVLIINAFDRTGGAAWFDDENYAGFLPMVDQGVPYAYDLHTVGSQFDYLKTSPWLDDDSPGHGASYADLEQFVIPGNTFDFSYVHGKSIRAAGYAFVSVSDEAFVEKSQQLERYHMLDFLAGEERTTYMPKNDSVPFFTIYEQAVLDKLSAYLSRGGNLFISGAHIASDMHALGQDSLIASMFGYKWRTSNASKVGEFYFMDPDFAPPSRQFRFNTGLHPTIYTVEGADALEPVDSTAFSLVRYAENNMSAGVSLRENYAVVSMGFPFECILGEADRNFIMEKIITNF